MKPTVRRFTVPVRWAAPQALAMARGLGWLHGHGIDGQTGTIRYGYPSNGTRNKYGGYAFPPQLFIGYDPQKVAAGFIRPDPASIPGTSMTSTAEMSPLQRALSTSTFGIGG